jgi:hypothetical protein
MGDGILERVSYDQNSKERKKERKRTYKSGDTKTSLEEL